MLLINSGYKSLNKIISNKIINESKDSDKFERQCARYLRKQYPNHKFTVKGGNDRSVSDILVDDKFYIECKMTEHNNKTCGVQSTGFGIKLIEDGDKRAFECSDTAADSNLASQIMSYINDNIDDFVKLSEPHTSKIKLDLDQNIFAKWISDYYLKKNVEFFVTILNNEYSIFRNTPSNISKYLDITAYARYYSSGSKDLPESQRDEIISGLKKQLKVSSVKQDGKKLFIKLSKDVDNVYYDVGDYKIYLSDKVCKPNEYRVMKLTCAGSPRVIFNMIAKSNQDKKDLAQFEKFLNNK